MTEPSQPPRTERRVPRVDVPAGACDTHAHVFAPAGTYPYAAARPYTPAPGSDLGAYRAMLAAVGIERAVLVHSNIYGPDNRATLDALGEMTGAWRGIALIRPETDDATLDALAGAGMCGIRINLQFPGETGLDDVEAMAPRLADRDWHLQMLVHVDQLPVIAPRLEALPLDVVIDHMGMAAPDQGREGGGMRSLLALLETGRCWVKLSAPYYGGDTPPDYPSAAALARRLFSARPDRMLFGTNWPHPHTDPPPDEGDLVDWIAAVTGSAGGLRQVLVENPAKLYGFEA